jgi:hypothetical protein
LLLSRKIRSQAVNEAFTAFWLCLLTHYPKSKRGSVKNIFRIGWVIGIFKALTKSRGTTSSIMSLKRNL